MRQFRPRRYSIAVIKQEGVDTPFAQLCYLAFYFCPSGEIRGSPGDEIPRMRRDAKRDTARFEIDFMHMR